MLAERYARLLSRYLRFPLPNYWRNGIKNFVALVYLQEERPPAPRRLDTMFGSGGKSAGVCWLAAVTIIMLARANAGATEFRFDRDTIAFANQTVFEYHEGHPSLRKPSTVRRDAYKRHCFVLCRTAMQFKKFARFDPRSAQLDDTSLAARIRAATHRAPCAHPLPESQRTFSPNPGVERYLVYGPNHPESPRELTWSPRDRAFSYQKDWDFVGGFVRVYQVYGKWLQ